MTTVFLAPGAFGAGGQFFTTGGLPLNQGQIYTYIAGGTTPQATYTTSAGSVQNANPIILDVDGRTPNEIWMTSASYRFDLKDSLGNLIKTYDNLIAPDINAAALAASSGSGLVGFIQNGVGAVATDLQTEGRRTVCITQFGASAFATAATNTTAIALAITYGIANKAKVIAPGGSFAVNQIVIQDAVYDFTFHCENTEFVGAATSAYSQFIDIVNCVDFHWTGSCHINVNNNTNYAAAFSLRAQAGTSQATTRINVHNVTVRNAKIAFSNGNYTLDYQCSEINLFGCNAFKCPVALYNGGSQTGLSANGCNLVAEANAAFAGAPERAIWMEGGFVSVDGGSVVQDDAVSESILLNPASSVTYGNPYGILRIVGAHTELSSPIFISNPRALSAPTSDNAANLTINACGGFIAVAAATDFIQITDSTYAGYVQIGNDNFYAPNARSGNNISSTSSSAKIKVDRGSFNKNFLNWLSGVSGGDLLHDFVPAMSATGINTSIGGAGEAVIKFLTNNITNELGRYGGNYSVSTGLFTIPAGGLKSLRVMCSIVGGGATTGDIYIKKNATITFFGPYNGLKGNVYGTFYNLVAGDTVGVYLNGVASIAFDNGVYQILQMEASNY